METRKMIVGMIMVVLVSISGAAWATQYYVSPDGNDNNSGTTWATAFKTIGKGVDTAVDDDFVDVNEGTYTENVSFDGNSITLRSTDPNDWDVVGATIIDGNNTGRVVLFDSSEGANSVLRGFTITKGKAPLDSSSGYYPGNGIFCDGSSPKITNCLITGNVPNQTDSDGAIACYRSANPEITNCIIKDNIIDWSAGISISGNCSPTIKNCIISNNSASEDGGGIYFYDNGDAMIVNCTISGNAAENGGGMVNCNSDPCLVSCIVWGNEANATGDEVYKIYSGEPNFYYSDVKGCGGSGPGWDPNFGADGGGNISSYPYFEDWDANDFHLTWNSPCINRGDPNFADSNETDIDGEERVIEGRMDMGADELNRSINLIKNPGFESFDGNDWPDWSVVQWDGNDGIAESDPNGYDGNCVKMTRKSAYMLVSQDIGKLIPGEEYVLSAMFKVGISDHSAISLYDPNWKDAEGDTAPVFFSAHERGNGGWNKITVFARIPLVDHNGLSTEEHNWRVYLYGWGTADGNKPIWYDNVNLSLTSIFSPPYGCINESDISKSIDFGSNNDEDPNYNGGIILWDVGAGYGLDPNRYTEGDITYRAILANKYVYLKIPGFNLDPNDTNLPATPMLLELMFKDDADSSGNYVEIDSGLFYCSSDSNIPNYKRRYHQILKDKRLGLGEWRFVQYAFQLSPFTLLHTNDDGYWCVRIKASGASVAIDYLTLRVAQDEYPDFETNQLDVKGYYETQLPTEQPADTNYSDPNITVFVRDLIHPVYPQTRPEQNEPNGINGFSALGELEAVAFSIYSENGVNDLTFEVSDLSSTSDDSNIPAENISIFEVVYDNARLAPFASKASKSCALIGDRLEECTTLSIDPNTSKSIWLKIKIPEDITGGLYTGQIDIKENEVFQQLVKIEINVLPVILEDSEHINTVVADPYHTVYSSNQDEVFKLYRRTGIEGFYHNGYEIEPLTDSNGLIVDFDTNDFKKILNKYIEEGYLKEGRPVWINIWNTWRWIYDELYGGDPESDVNLYYSLSKPNSPNDPDFPEAFGMAIDHYLDIAESNNMTFIFGVRDEVGTAFDRIVVDRLFEIIKDNNGLTVSPYNTHCDKPYDVTAESYNTPDDMNIPTMAYLTDYKVWYLPHQGEGYANHCNDVNYGNFAYYNFSTSYLRNPIYRRFSHGLRAFRTEAHIVHVYAMGDWQSDPFNDFDAQTVSESVPYSHWTSWKSWELPDWLLAYPTWSGKPLPTMALEGIREGIKDAKYIATLKYLIADDPNKPVAQAAQDYLDEIKSRIDPDYYSAYILQSTVLGYYQEILEDISDTNDPNDFEAFTEVRRHIADYIVWIDPNEGYRVHNITTDTWYKTINDAIDEAASGDEIVAHDANYYESVDFDGKAITVRSADPNDWDVVAATVIDANGAAQAVDVDANATLSGFTITGGTYGVYCDSASPTISRCIIEDNSSAGVYCNGGSPEIENNKICDNSSYGIHSNGSSASIKNNWVYRNGDEGIHFAGTASPAPMVRNNTVAYNTNHGVLRATGNVTSPTVSNCILWANNDDLDRCSATYSCIEDNDNGTGNIYTDPNFVDSDANDYHIEADSPCIDASNPNEPNSSTEEVDIDGELRVIGIADIGADEVDYRISHWRFDEGSGTTTYDSVGSNDGTINGDPNWVTGKIGSWALDFDGSGDYVEVADDNSLDITDEITITMWLYQKEQSTAGGCGVTKDLTYKFGPENTPKYVLRMETTGGSWSTQFLKSNSATILDAWTHIAATYDSDANTSRIYINGGLDIESTTAITGTIETNTANLWIGRGANPYFDGTIDEVIICDRALSSKAIKKLYQNGL